LTALIRLTPKAFANSSPGFDLKPWVQERIFRFVATLKALRWVATVLSSFIHDATPSEVATNEECHLDPGFQSKPWAEISERFQRTKRNKGRCASNLNLPFDIVHLDLFAMHLLRSRLFAYHFYCRSHRQI